MSKNSYFYQVNAINKPDKYIKHRELIRLSFSESNGTYGYRRIHLDMKESNMCISEKVIRRLMKEENLVVKTIKKKKYNSYMGEISPAVDNLIKRDFHSDKPNAKWLTDCYADSFQFLYWLLSCISIQAFYAVYPEDGNAW